MAVEERKQGLEGEGELCVTRGVAAFLKLKTCLVARDEIEIAHEKGDAWETASSGRDVAEELGLICETRRGLEVKVDELDGEVAASALKGKAAAWCEDELDEGVDTRSERVAHRDDDSANSRRRCERSEMHMCW